MLRSAGCVFSPAGAVRLRSLKSAYARLAAGSFFLDRLPVSGTPGLKRSPKVQQRGEPLNGGETEIDGVEVFKVIKVTDTPRLSIEQAVKERMRGEEAEVGKQHDSPRGRETKAAARGLARPFGEQVPQADSQRGNANEIQPMRHLLGDKTHLTMAAEVHGWPWE